jgi:hypothetical protein
MGEIDDYKRRENIKGMAKLIGYLLCEDKKEYLMREDKENKTSLIWIHGELVSDRDAR